MRSMASPTVLIVLDVVALELDAVLVLDDLRELDEVERVDVELLRGSRRGEICVALGAELRERVEDAGPRSGRCGLVVVLISFGRSRFRRTGRRRRSGSFRSRSRPRRRRGSGRRRRPPRACRRAGRGSAFGELVADVLGHVGVDEAGRDRVDGHAAARDLGGDGLGQADQARPSRRRSWPGPALARGPTIEATLTIRPKRARSIGAQRAAGERGRRRRGWCRARVSQSSSSSCGERPSARTPALLTRHEHRAERVLGRAEQPRRRRRGRRRRPARASACRRPARSRRRPRRRRRASER